MRCWLCWRRVVKMSSLTVKKPKYKSHCYLLWMGRHGAIGQWDCLRVPPDYQNSLVSGSSIQNTVISSYFSQLVLATGPGNPPAVRVWTTKTGWFGSKPGQKPDLLTLGGPNPDPYKSTCRFRRVWLDPLGPISGSAFRVSHLWSHSDMLLLIVKYWHWYVTVHFRRISRLDVQNTDTHAPNHILKMSVNRASTECQQSVNRASTIFGLASSVIWVVLDQKHP